MSELTRIRSYATRTEAEFAKEVLRSAGIVALVNVADAGGSRPEVAFSTGASLFVNSGQVAEAQAMLGANETPEDKDLQQARAVKFRGCLGPAILGGLLFILAAFAGDYLAEWVGMLLFAAGTILIVIALIRGWRAA